MKATPTRLFINPSDRVEQTVIRLPLTIVEGNRDYRQREYGLRRMDELLIASGVEAACVAHAVAAEIQAGGRGAAPLMHWKLRCFTNLAHYPSRR